MSEKKIIRLPGAHERGDDLPFFSQEALEVFNQMVEGYNHYHLGALRHTAETVRGYLQNVQEFIDYSNKMPWDWDEYDFESWCYHLGRERKLAVSTQRKYQTSIRDFLKYLTKNIKFKQLVQQRFGVGLRQIVHSDNAIPHTQEHEGKQPRRALTYEEVDLFFDGLEAGIREAARFSSKSYHPLQRDKCFFFLLYAAGLRISEGRHLNLDDFEPDPARQSLGELHERYGFIRIWGKGSRGSGPKFRSVPVTHPLLPALLQWYIDKVRPHFLDKADPNEQALFLSQQGQRPALSTLESRFVCLLRLAGLEGRGLTPHCLRHTSVTHELARLSVEAVRRKSGHSHAAVTQGYTHIPDEHITEEIDTMHRRHLADILKGGKPK